MLHPDIWAMFKKDAWGEHPDFPRRAWQDAAYAGETQLGYWDWVQHRRDEKADAVLENCF